MTASLSALNKLWKKSNMERKNLILVGVLLFTPLVFFGQEVPSEAKTEKIAWHGTWEGGLAEAQRTGKPIMLVSAVPQCHSVPGVW